MFSIYKHMARTKSREYRSLQDWMERTQTRGDVLVRMVREQTGRSISQTMISFILRGSRQCSMLNADALCKVTGVPFQVLREWPKVSSCEKVSVRRPSCAA